ncbi:Carboxylesterase type B, conserved site,Carboxylesterase, type B,Alpha/Beta hydrolase fold [Cinara cedri]|uniref:Carboxylesterase type B, conserved site,Carboxylesterase, type B,Alpha/Beta hydrolase fold n=1 Tax=Cinara cedri TaxID=506608 RepID=A0A5E4NAA3_9HEMI|nr:Carboxylesterase type B, conserved site,Carboxylesterase, type B,Alpha/Beta hydrolase fold [Cinara cedri]
MIVHCWITEMNIIALWSCVVFAVDMFISVGCQPVFLKTKNGVIKGRILKSRDGRPYHSYTGIPYAKPPIQRLRFMPPESAEPWNGTWDATKEPNICIQEGYVDGYEDCLYLNVYAPETDKKRLPVIFWIHGGGFTWGHSGSGLFGPAYFMDKDVVLVTINYRLGILGFLSTEDDVLPGNYGMKDQVLALRWVRENIITFNGDPDQVTICGGSAGSASVGFHMLSPMSKGLFHKAILQSGSPVCIWANCPSGVSRKRAYSVATIAGCNFNNSEDILNCLRILPAKYLQSEMHTKLFTWLKYPAILFSPVVENCKSRQEAFLCHHPIYDFQQESFVPAIIGMNSAEGGLMAIPLYNRTSLLYTEFSEDFNRLWPIISGYNFYVTPENIHKIVDKIRKKYYPSGSINDDSHSETVKMFTDSIFTKCVFEMAYQLSSPVYGYIYNYQNEFSHNKIYGSCDKPLGVTHGDEMNSLFKMNDLNPIELNEEDLKVSKLMINIWYKFVSTDIPTVDGLENSTPWSKFTQSDQSIMYVDSDRPVLIKNPYVDVYEFWKKLPITSIKKKL